MTNEITTKGTSGEVITAQEIESNLVRAGISGEARERLRDLVAMGPLTEKPIDSVLLAAGLACQWEADADGTIDATHDGIAEITSGRSPLVVYVDTKGVTMGDAAIDFLSYLLPGDAELIRCDSCRAEGGTAAQRIAAMELARIATAKLSGAMSKEAILTRLRDGRLVAMEALSEFIASRS